MKITFFCLFILCCTSCSVLDITKSNSNICEVHEIEMNKTKVKTVRGKSCPRKIKKEYPHAKTVLCMGCVNPDQKSKRGIIYTCRECNKLQRKDSKYWRNRYNK